MIRFHVEKYIVPASEETRIVVLSDIHYYNKKMQKLLNAILKQIDKWHPNYICMPGDFIDESEIQDEECFLSFLNSLKDRAPVILSIGNHEVKKKKVEGDTINQDFFAKIKNISNVYLLDNTSLERKNLRFIGLTLPTKSYDETKQSPSITYEVVTKLYPNGLKKDKYNIVLSHSPFCLLYEKVQKTKFYQDSDLILAGHTHAGLTPTWIAKRMQHVFITPQRHLFPKNSYGYLKCEKTIVSSGVTKLSHFNPLRYFNFLFSSEIVVIDLKKER